MTQKTILLTGGTGFIASHTAVQLIQSGYTVVLVDNLANSQKSVVHRIESITQKSVPFYKANVCNPSALQKIFKIHDIYAVVHFAALKSVGESVKNPNLYYKNNIGGLESVLAVMEQNECYNLVFSSSATVYGTPEKCPIVETHPLRATNPYGETKIACEEILQAMYSKKWHMAILRYFNPIGAHPSGDLGEDPRGIPNNLAPYVAQVATGQLESVGVFGNDYNTADGTGVRDYIHVMDLADGHVSALHHINKFAITAINLGTGSGYSVLQLIQAFEQVLGAKIPYTIQPRRAGDVSTCYADVKLALDIMGWRARYDIQDMATHHLRWVQNLQKI